MKDKRDSKFLSLKAKELAAKFTSAKFGRWHFCEFLLIIDNRSRGKAQYSS